MKITIAFLLLIVVSCQTPNESAKPESNAPMVGNDSDAHGCKGSAGYTWSVVKSECIRTWETGVQLQPTQSQGTSVSTASIVFDDKNERAELFCVEETSSVILNKKTEDASSPFIGKNYSLQQRDGKWELSKAGVVVYLEK